MSKQFVLLKRCEQLFLFLKKNKVNLRVCKSEYNRTAIKLTNCTHAHKHLGIFVKCVCFLSFTFPIKNSHNDRYINILNFASRRIYEYVMIEKEKPLKVDIF